jgi:membrane-associated protein
MLELIQQLIDFILHIDKHLLEIVTNYQTWTYLILFAIIFCETGLVVTPFLPGDSLLFATGAIAAMEGSPLDVNLVAPMLILAAVLGDNTNYWIGRLIGDKVYARNYKLIKREYLDKTHAFYEKYGRITLIVARFMPIIRTFAPFVAGVGSMKYLRFFSFSLIGNVLWVCLFTYAGNFFGNIPVIKQNFTLVVMAIIAISLIPPVYTVVKVKYFSKAS